MKPNKIFKNLIAFNIFYYLNTILGWITPNQFFLNVKISRMLKVSEAVTDIISGYLPKYPPYELAPVSPSKTKLYDYTKKKG